MRVVLMFLRMALGASFIVVGTIVQGVTVHIMDYHRATNQFMGGRFLLGLYIYTETQQIFVLTIRSGFGVSLVASAGPMVRLKDELQRV